MQSVESKTQFILVGKDKVLLAGVDDQKIPSTTIGNHIINNVGDQNESICGEMQFQGYVSKYKSLVCNGCGMRILVPANISYYGSLREWIEITSSKGFLKPPHFFDYISTAGGIDL
jgi:hypothetical protein